MAEQNSERPEARTSDLSKTNIASKRNKAFSMDSLPQTNNETRDLYLSTPSNELDVLSLRAAKIMLQGDVRRMKSCLATIGLLATPPDDTRTDRERLRAIARMVYGGAV